MDEGWLEWFHAINGWIESYRKDQFWVKCSLIISKHLVSEPKMTQMKITVVKHFFNDGIRAHQWWTESVFWQPDPDEFIAVIPFWYGSQMEVKVGQHWAITHLLFRERCCIASIEAGWRVVITQCKKTGAFKDCLIILEGLQRGQY